VIKKQLLEKTGWFDESLAGSEDSEMLFRLSFHGGYLYLDEPMVVIQVGTANSLTSDQTPAVVVRRLDSYLRVQAEVYWRLVLVTPGKAAVTRQRMAYYALRRAQLACATGDFLLARTLVRRTVIMTADWRVLLAGAGLYLFPRWLQASCRRRFKC
jgi:hypothetical protein